MVLGLVYFQKPKYSKNFLKRKGNKVDDRHKRYASSEKGQEARKRANKNYDERDTEKRRKQKRDYMRRKRTQDPNYCKWK
tara:strand:+ start:1068 stop:1307 length:240 start_codon:yes stop_codon:yes gene_type:complete